MDPSRQWNIDALLFNNEPKLESFENIGRK